MFIRVRVTPNAREASVVKVDEGDYEAKVDEKAIGGRANARLLQLLSEKLDVPKSRISIVKGARSRDKVIQVSP